MVKKLIAAFSVICLISSGMTVFAQEADTPLTNEEITNENKQTILELSLSDAINMALTDNLLVAAADAAEESAKLAVKVATEQKKDYKDFEDSIPNDPSIKIQTAIRPSQGLEKAYLKHGYYLMAANVAYELSTMEKEKVRATVEYEVIEKYYNVKLMEHLVTISCTGLEIAEENCDVVKKNFELGYVSQLEVKNVENAVLKAQNSLAGYKRNLEIATESLKISLKLDKKDVTLVLTDEVTIPDMVENAQEKIESAMNTRYDVTALKKSNELAAKHFDVTSSYASKKMAMYHSSYSAYLESDAKCKNSLKLIKLSLKNSYNALLTAKENITTAKNDVEIKEIDYDSAKIKFEMGLITNLELTGKMAELDSAKVQLENAQVTYLLAVKKFEYDTTIGL